MLCLRQMEPCCLEGSQVRTPVSLEDFTKFAIKAKYYRDRYSRTQLTLVVCLSMTPKHATANGCSTSDNSNHCFIGVPSIRVGETGFEPTTIFWEASAQPLISNN